MVDTSIEQFFIKQYASELHTAYQREGSEFRNFVRRSTKQPGQDITFPIYGKGAATRGKTRHGLVPTMNNAHSTKTVTLVDSFAAQWIDRFDLLKTNVDERQAAISSAVMALGRDTDKHIVDVLDTATNNTNINLSAIAVADLTKWLARLRIRDVPLRPDRVTVAVTPYVWAKLLTLQEFANSQWVGPDALPLKTPGMQAKMWGGAMWFSSSALTGGDSATASAKCHAWDRMAIGHGVAAEVQTTVSWENTHNSFFCNSNMSQGAVLIDNDGVEKLTVAQNA